ncbi:PRC-barrel domain-containing protein [Sporomusa acidovorans]|nr:PRC-barrel domain-containing protein [Sporomusa acidovorans]
MMKKSVDIIGQPVISITEGKELGNVKELLINQTNGTIAALVIDDGKWYLGARLLPFEGIAGLGEYAVTVNTSEDIIAVADRPEFEKMFEAGVKVIGTKVLTRGGKIYGKIIELRIDNSGKIVTCDMEKEDSEVVEIPAQSIVTFGKEVLIIADSSDSNEVSNKNSADVNVEAAPVKPVIDTVAASQPEVIETPQPEEIIEEIKAENKEDVKEQEQQPVDDSAKKFDDKHRKFLLGKKAARRIETDNGMLIIEQGAEITEEVLQKAKLAGKFVELSMNIQ